MTAAGYAMREVFRGSVIYGVISAIPSMRRTCSEESWPLPQPTTPCRGESPAAPAITVTRVGVVLGADFLPDHEVTVSITRPGDSVSDYVTYTSDRNGDLHAELPATAVTGMLRIAATDHRPDPEGQMRPDLE